MQEDIEQRSIVLTTQGSKITARVLAKAMAVALRQMKKTQDKPGKMSKRQLGKGGVLENIEITDDNIKAFEPIARKHKIHYSLERDNSTDPPRWLVYFRSNEAGAMTSAFKEFATQTLKRQQSKPSIRETMAHFKDVIKNAIIDRTRHKERGGPEL
jgi:hypothetical protein